MIDLDNLRDHLDRLRKIFPNDTLCVDASTESHVAIYHMGLSASKTLVAWIDKDGTMHWPSDESALT